jgi:hypothetical protein
LPEHQGARQDHLFLGSAGEPFLRPGLIIDKTPRAAAVKDWPQANRVAALSVLDGGEHGVILKRGGLNQPSAVAGVALVLERAAPDSTRRNQPQHRKKSVASLIFQLTMGGESPQQQTSG